MRKYKVEVIDYFVGVRINSIPANYRPALLYMNAVSGSAIFTLEISDLLLRQIHFHGNTHNH